MNKQQTIQALSNNKTVLTQRFGVTRLALFGSTARDAATANSDVDILVDFDGAATSQRYFGVQFYLEDLLGCTIDLVTEKALRAELRPSIKREAMDVWNLKWIPACARMTVWVYKIFCLSKQYLV